LESLDIFLFKSQAGSESEAKKKQYSEEEKNLGTFYMNFFIIDSKLSKNKKRIQTLPDVDLGLSLLFLVEKRTPQSHRNDELKKMKFNYFLC
jgi:hypothetical protein